MSNEQNERGLLFRFNLFVILPRVQKASVSFIYTTRQKASKIFVLFDWESTAVRRQVKFKSCKQVEIWFDKSSHFSFLSRPPLETV